MEAMGKGSISSAIKIILNVMWYMSWIGLGLVGLVMLFGAVQVLTDRETLGGYALDSTSGGPCPHIVVGDETS